MERAMRNQPTRMTSGATHRSGRSAERVSDGLLVALLALLEVAPLEALLLMYAAASATPLSQAFGPLWLIVATLLVFALARWRLERRGAGLVALTSLLIGAGAFVLFVALSPTAYGATPGGLFSARWLLQLQGDIALDAPRVNGLLSIAPFVAYLGWRGLTLGGPLPRVETTLRRFTISMTAEIIACLGAIAAPASAQASLTAALLATLALNVFAGLAAAALARRGTWHDLLGDEATNAETLRWVLTACGAAATVIVVALAAGLPLSLVQGRSLLAALSPVGDTLNAALAWLTNALAYALWFAFVRTLGAWLFQNVSFNEQQPQRGAPAAHSPPHHVVTPPHALIIAAETLIIAAIVTVIVLGVVLAVRSLLRATRAPDEPEQDEDRESLDARGLLRRQWRDLLARLWGGAGAQDVDPLPRGGVRWLYRELLRAGAAAGLARRASETADEYNQRLALTLRERGAGDELYLTALTEDYDNARYGDRAATPSPRAAEEAQRATSALTRLRAEP